MQVPLPATKERAGMLLSFSSPKNSNNKNLPVIAQCSATGGMAWQQQNKTKATDHNGANRAQATGPHGHVPHDTY